MRSNPFDPEERLRKVERIFDLFDADGDGALNRQEMAALVMAANPRVRFSAAQISAILDEIFRCYGERVAGDTALRCDGLLRTYNDGAGDLDRDFLSLGLTLSPREEEDDADVSPARTPPRQGPRAWSGSGGDTCQVLDDVDVLIRRGGRVSRLGFQRALSELAGRADCCRTQDEAFDAHMAMGRALSDAGFHSESLHSFRRASELRPLDVRPHFRSGIALARIGSSGAASDAFSSALDAAAADPRMWAPMLPQIRVNLGVSLEGEGLLLSAAEQYRSAAILCPDHYRALKQLGSALLGGGDAKSAEFPLRQALQLAPDYADAHADLGAALAELGQSDKAAAELRHAIRLQPDHGEAVFNLARLQAASGNYADAVSAYSRLLVADPRHWRAALNRAAALIGAGDLSAAIADLRLALRLTGRPEIGAELRRLRHLTRAGADVALAAARHQVDECRFLVFGGGATSPRLLRAALHAAGLRGRVPDVAGLLRQLRASLAHCVAAPADVEAALRRHLPAAPPAAFAGLVHCVNSRAMALVIAGSTPGGPSGAACHVDAAMLAALLAGACDTCPLPQRRRVAFDALAWRRSCQVGGALDKRELGEVAGVADVVEYFGKLRQLYGVEAEGEEADVADDADAVVSYSEFSELVEETAMTGHRKGATFAELWDVAARLERGGRHRRRGGGGMRCSVCSYEVVGPWFKEVSAGFSLCSECYSRCMVPASHALQQDCFCFKEYASDGDALKERIVQLGNKLRSFSHL